MFLGKDVLKIGSKFTGEHHMPKCDFSKVTLGVFKSTFVMEWGGGSLKVNENELGERGSSLSVSSLCEKKYLIFQTANRVLSDMLFGSC